MQFQPIKVSEVQTSRNSSHEYRNRTFRNISNETQVPKDQIDRPCDSASANFMFIVFILLFVVVCGIGTYQDSKINPVPKKEIVQKYKVMDSSGKEIKVNVYDNEGIDELEYRRIYRPFARLYKTWNDAEKRYFLVMLNIFPDGEYILKGNGRTIKYTISSSTSYRKTITVQDSNFLSGAPITFHPFHGVARWKILE